MEYVSRMRKNIKELVDFEKLKKSNDLCFKWSKRMKISRRDYMKFILSIYKNPESIIEKIKPRYLTEYKKDIQNMFYAQQIENLLAEQYHAMIFNIMHKMRIDFEKFDEFVTDGFLAIRSATWQYRTKYCTLLAPNSHFSGFSLRLTFLSLLKIICNVFRCCSCVAV